MLRLVACRALCVLAGLLVGAMSTAATSSALDEPLPVSLHAMPLGDALRALARQSQLQTLFDAALVKDRQAPAIEGRLTPREAFATLLLDTGLEAREEAPGVIVVRRVIDANSATGIPVERADVKRADLAQDSGLERPELLQEVIVTAQRRAERLQTVPISITVHRRATMEAQGTRSIADVSRLTPGVTFVPGANNNNSESSAISIRGIASDAGASTTGVYIDDTPIHGRNLSFPSFNTYPALFDVERVEVLRGPQGTLFGAGSEGGTIRFISPEADVTRPSLYARTELAFTAGGDPLYEAGVAAGAPLIDDRLGLRASASLRHEGGYVDRVDWHAGRVSRANANSSRTATARLAAKWQVTDTLSIAPSIYYQRRETDDTSASWTPRQGEPDASGGQFERPFRSGNAVASPDADAFVLPALKIEWQGQALRFVSSTSFFDRRQTARTDYSQFNRAIFFQDPYPPPGVRGVGYWGDAQRSWTQEVRVESLATEARVSWTAGLFLQRAREATRHRVRDPALLIEFGLPPDTNDGYIYVEDPRVGVDRQVAVFGQADLRLTARTKLTLGLRQSWAKFLGATNYPESLVVGPAVSSQGEFREHPVTPRIGLAFQRDAETLLYATAAKGFRIGGVNAKVGQFCYGGPDSALGRIGLDDVPATFDSDSVWSYEVGAKTLLAARRMMLNVSAYHIRWSDIQQNVPLTACGFQFTSNLGRATSTGFDLQTALQLTEDWSIGGTLSVGNARFTRTVQLQPTVQSIVRRGDHLAGAPWTAAVFGEYSRPAGDGRAYLRTDYQYGAEQTDRVPASNPLNGGYARWFAGVPSLSNTAVRAGFKGRHLDLSLFVQNVFDTRPPLTTTQDIATASGGTPLFYVISWRPRTVGLTATIRY
jgi:outer membrane receptor protein involved in Fe transport